MVVHPKRCTNKQHVGVHLYECTYAISYTAQLYIHLFSVYTYISHMITLTGLGLGFALELRLRLGLKLRLEIEFKLRLGLELGFDFT